MNTCIVSLFTCSFDDFKAMVEKTQSEWSQLVDGYHIAKIDDHKYVMVMDTFDFEAMGAFILSEEMKAWDVKNGCIDNVYSISEMTEWGCGLKTAEYSFARQPGI